ncbi:MAG: hypothetical protein ACTSSO_05415 [Candidatus Hodarchaeales archaeon]
MLEKISKEFYDSGTTFDEFLKEGTEDEAKRTQLYYSKSAKNFTPDRKVRRTSHLKNCR